MFGAFMAGSIVGKLAMDTKKWSESVAKVKKDQKSMADGASTFSSKMKTAGKVMTGLGAAIVGVLGVSVKAAISFNKEMASVATLIPKAGDRLIELKTNVQDLAMATGKSTTDIAQGLYQVISAFQDGADTAEILEINVKAAAAGLSTTTDAINLTSAVMKGYGTVSAAAAQHAADLAFETVKLGQTTFPQLAASMGRTIPIAAKLNVTQEELFASYATLTGVTGDAFLVTTQLRGAMTSMMKPSEEMAAAMKSLGYNSAETMIKELGLVGSMKALIGTTDGSSTAVAKLFTNVRALPAVFALTGAQAETFNEKLAAMQDVSGSMNEAFKAMTEGINATGFDMSRLKQMTVVLAQRIGDTLAPTIGRIVVSFGKVVSAIGTWTKEHPKLTDAIVKFTAAVGALMVAIGPILMIWPKIIMLMGGVTKAVKGVIAGFQLLRTASIATLGPIGLLTAALGALTSLPKNSNWQLIWPASRKKNF